MSGSDQPATTGMRDPFLQRRVRLLLACIFVLVAVFTTHALIEVVWLDLEIGKLPLLPLASCGLVSGVGVILLWNPRSRRFVHALELCSLLLLGLLAVVTELRVPIGLRPDLTLVLMFAVVVIGRAAFVPTTPWRTLVICALYAVGLVIVSWHTYARYEPRPPDYPEITQSVATVFVLVSWTVVTLLAMLISKVIYGLRREVSAALELGQYSLIEKLGEGGHGEVYRARHALLHRPTAVKLLPPTHSSGRALARFEREVQLTAELTHPNTITIFDYGHTSEGVFYYAMEYLDGANLDEVVSADGPQPAARVCYILQQTADALEEAHAAGLIHRDIKPSNVMLARRGNDPDTVKVLDFGLAMAFGREGPAGKSADRGLVGTPLYMAPEVIKSADAASEQCDVYALGAVGYFLLTGTHVFDGSSVVEVCAKHLHEQPESPSDRLGRPVPPELEALVLACLAKEPEDRPAGAAGVAAALRSCAGIERWTRQDADAWWAVYSARVRDQAQVSPVASGRTVTVGRVTQER